MGGHHRLRLSSTENYERKKRQKLSFLVYLNQCDWGPEMVALDKTKQRYVRMCVCVFFSRSSHVPVTKCLLQIRQCGDVLMNPIAAIHRFL